MSFDAPTEHVRASTTRRRSGGTLLRRCILAGLATALAAPVFAVGPAGADEVTVFSCTTFTGDASLTPGMGHDRAFQEMVATASIDGCDNGQTGTLTVQLTQALSQRRLDLGCPVALGGAGPDWLPGRLIARGLNTTFTIDWATGADSTGNFKVRAGATPSEWKLIFGVASGQYVLSFPRRMRIKAIVSWVPTDSFTCADNSDPISAVSFNLSDPLNQPLMGLDGKAAHLPAG